MTRVLVVDDAAIDRALIRGLIQAGTSLEVREASDGEDAFRQLQVDPPDLIVTDMHMPRMDGLALVEAVHRDFPSIPVVLVTGQGNEELAVMALRAGAASYVPKIALSQQLVQTVMQVLSVAREHQVTQRVRESLRYCEWEFELENDVHVLGPVITLLRQALQDFQICDLAEGLQIGMVLEAALSNAIYHGNLELSRDDLNGLTYDLFDISEPSIVEQRQHTAPYCDRRVTFRAKISGATATFMIRDQGSGFDHREMLISPSQLVANPQARGIAHMRLFADEMVFNEQGNELTLRISRRISS